MVTFRKQVTLAWDHLGTSVEWWEEPVPSLIPRPHPRESGNEIVSTSCRHTVDVMSKTKWLW